MHLHRCIGAHSVVFFGCLSHGVFLFCPNPRGFHLGARLCRFPLGAPGARRLCRAAELDEAGRCVGERRLELLGWIGLVLFGFEFGLGWVGMGLVG